MLVQQFQITTKLCPIWSIAMPHRARRRLYLERINLGMMKAYANLSVPVGKPNESGVRLDYLMTTKPSRTSETIIILNYSTLNVPTWTIRLLIVAMTTRNYSKWWGMFSTMINQVFFLRSAALDVWLRDLAISSLIRYRSSETPCLRRSSTILPSIWSLGLF